MSTAPVEISTPPDEPVIVMRRVVRASPEQLFEAYTNPEHLRNWWGPRALTMVVCDLDLQVGGSYRFVHRAPDGQEFGFHGTYREISPPHRLVNTFVYEGTPDEEALDTVEFEEVAGATLVTTTSVHASIGARDAHVAAGMESGVVESFARLDELVASLQTA